MPKYYKVEDGEWIQPMPQVGHKMCCCDCGLVHTVNFRVFRGQVQLQAIRNKKATASVRRNKKHKKQKLYL